MTEDSIQAQIVKWFTNHYCLKHHSPRSVIFSVPNGGSRHFLEAQKFRATGLLPGASDLIMVHRGKVYFIELKTTIGRQSPAQADFQARIQSNNLDYKIFRSLEEFQNFVVSL